MRMNRDEVLEILSEVKTQVEITSWHLESVPDLDIEKNLGEEGSGPWGAVYLTLLLDDITALLSRIVPNIDDPDSGLHFPKKYQIGRFDDKPDPEIGHIVLSSGELWVGDQNGMGGLRIDGDISAAEIPVTVYRNEAGDLRTVTIDFS